MTLFAFLSLFAWAACLTMTLVSLGEGTAMQQPSFSAEPPSQAVVEPNTTAPFVWNITYSSCLNDTNPKSDGWRLKVLMNEYDLYPNSQPEYVPIKNITDYTVHVECQNDNTIVNLTIIFNENVLEYAEFVLCRVTKRQIGKEPIVVENRVNFTTIVQTTETTTVSVATLTSFSTLRMETTTDSGCRQCVHFCALVLCLFVASFLPFLWQS